MTSRPAGILLTGAALALCTLSGSAQQTQPASSVVRVHYGDGVIVEVSDWTFEYEYGESDTPPKGLFTFTTKQSRDLLVEVGSSTDRGITLTDERTISELQLDAIAFDIADVVRGVTIRLVSGDVIRVPDLKPAKGLLTQKKHFFGGGGPFVEICPCINLIGTASRDGRSGAFKARINQQGRAKPANQWGLRDKIVELRFRVAR